MDKLSFNTYLHNPLYGMVLYVYTVQFSYYFKNKKDSNDDACTQFRQLNVY